MTQDEISGVADEPDDPIQAVAAVVHHLEVNPEATATFKEQSILNRLAINDKEMAPPADVQPAATNEATSRSSKKFKCGESFQGL